MAKEAHFVITSVQNRELIDSNGDGRPDGGANSTLLGKQSGVVLDGALLVMTLHRQRGGVDIGERELAQQVAHELIHAFGVPAWDQKVDNDRGWVDRVLNAAFGDRASYDATGGLPVGFTPFQLSGPSGGTLTAGGGEEALIGSIAADTFVTGQGKAHIFAGEGDDTIVLATAGTETIIVDDGGSDVIVLPQGTTAQAVSTRWSVDGLDMAVLANGVVAAIVVDAATDPVETLRVGGIDYATGSFATATNTAPAITSSIFEVIGTYQGYVGTVQGHDAELDTVTYRLAEIAGAYADQPWRLSPEGHIYADFMRQDAPGSEFTDIRVIASDGLDASEMWLAVRWGSGTSPYPELRLSGYAVDPEPIWVADAVLSPDLFLL